MGPLQNSPTLWLKNGGDPNYLLTGMIERFCLVLLGKVLVGIMCITPLPEDASLLVTARMTCRHFFWPRDLALKTFISVTTVYRNVYLFKVIFCKGPKN